LWKRGSEFALNQASIKINTAQQILDLAQDLVQTRGYNAFSYADIAKALKMSNASLHYHFPSKADLGNSLIARYENRFLQALNAIEGGGGTMAERFGAFVGIYSDVLADDHICLCGMLAAEFETLPQPMRSALDHFFEVTEAWLEIVLEEGRRKGEFNFDETAREVAQVSVAALEGAMILARSHGDHNRFHTAARRLIAGLARPKPISA
jgi:TetR/AcrR family transcriptional regulator, transcriptional repressor for nem operon